MKKYLSYSGILLIGLVLGWLLFGNPSNKAIVKPHPETGASNKMWTCSMHPQIMQPEAGDCPLCGMDLIPAETTTMGLKANEFKMTENAMALANIQTLVVGNSINKDAAIKLSGKISENEAANVVQASYFSGRIERLHINSTGEEVKKGQLLATIYAPELFAAQQELITAASLKETQPALYNAVRNKLKLWKISDSQINQIEASGKVTQNVPIYATVSGTVSEKLVAQGDYVKQGQALLKITNLNTVWALFDMYENQIELFEKGLDITVTTNAYPNKKFNNQVAFIDPVVNPTTRTVQLRVVLNNAKREFKTGMFVEATIHNSKLDKEKLLKIPASAILWTGTRAVVYIKTNANAPIFEMKEISIGKKVGKQYEVIKGLKKGDEIVSNGTFTVDAAAQLQGKKSMMNRAVAPTSSAHENHRSKDVSAAKVNERLQVASKFQNQLKTVFNNYIQLKDALVKGDSETVLSEVQDIVAALKKVDVNLLNDEKSAQDWNTLEEKITASLKTISAASAINVQRSHFKEISTHLISAIKIYGINETAYILYCPMAAGDTGAYWLSKEEKVMNPYFGDAMLHCGSVQQVIE